MILGTYVMNMETRKCCADAIRKRYHAASKEAKSLILDEFCNNCGYNRKYAIRLLAQKPNSRSKSTPGDSSSNKAVPAGRRSTYHSESFSAFVFRVWKTTNCICSKRLVVCLPRFAQFYLPALSADEMALTSTVSAATVDRILAPYRAQATKLGLSTTRPGSLIKKHIPIKTNQWDETKPGFVEADTVAHGGASTAGTFAYTLNLVDIATGWTIQRALWGKGQHTCFEALRDIESVLPFTLKGFDSDNGSEFINYHLLEYYSNRKAPVQYTRSRPYMKNDNAHIEQKNWTQVRQILGYMRFDNPDVVALMNDLYQNELYTLNNFFIPSFKLTSKKRVGQRVIKTHDQPKTPFDRLLETDTLPDYRIKSLKKYRDSINPFTLQKQIVLKVKKILSTATHELPNVRLLTLKPVQKNSKETA